MSDKSIWKRLAERLERMNPLAALSAPEDPTRTTAFTIAAIALCAKIAKADGRVTPDETAMFRHIFYVAPEDEARVAQVYEMLSQDAAAFEVYARRMRRMFDDDSRVLKDMLDALFAIAMADGEFHAAEEAFLETCAEIFEIDPRCYAEIMARWVPDRWDPWTVLGVAPGSDDKTVRARYLELVRDYHPDRMIARGLPEEMIELANRRLADVNRAYEALRAKAAPAL